MAIKSSSVLNQDISISSFLQSLSLSVAIFIFFFAIPLSAALASSSDHDRARTAVEQGQILPLGTILSLVEQEIPGQVIEVELERETSRWIYEIKILRKDGQRQKIKVDASSGVVINKKLK